MMADGWIVELNGTVLSGGDAPGDACLTLPPDGLGLPGVRTEDVTLPQRDGVRHFSDWYEPRIITVEAFVCPDGGCSSCPDPRATVRAIQQSWKRQCDDIELVVWPPCAGEGLPDRVNLAPTPSGNPTWRGTEPVAGPPNWVFGGGDQVDLSYPPVTIPGIDQDLTSMRSEVVDNTAMSALTASSFFPAEDGTPVNVTAWFRGTMTSRIRSQSLTGEPEVIGPWTDITDWTRQQLTINPVFVAPLDSYMLQITVESQDAPQNGDWLEIGAVLAETTPNGEYFDGSTPDSGELVHTWRGEPYSSPSSSGPDRSLVGPFGIIGRPRPEAGSLEWLPGRSRCAHLTLRFDAVDHRMYVLDADGTPGSGVSVVTVNPFTSTKCRSYPRCYPMCYEQENGEDPGDTVAEVRGTECTQPTICFTGRLTNPILENVTTGETIGYRGTIGEGDPPVCIDTETGLAEQGGANRTHLTTGNPQLALQPGENLLRLRSFSASDNGTAELSYRSIVVSA